MLPLPFLGISAFYYFLRSTFQKQKKIFTQNIYTINIYLYTDQIL